MFVSTSSVPRRPSPPRCLAILLLSLFFVVPIAVAQPAQPTVHVVEIVGVINPLSAEYLTRALAGAREEQAAAVVVRLDTPGGLDTSMRNMVQAIFDSSLPVILYVAPSGARAASAGLFICMAAHVCAMAPGTNIGAAHPVALGGEQEEASAEKATNDAAAFIRSLAEARGRNADWAERAVRESISASADEAASLNVADLKANDMTELLQAVDGRRVQTSAGEAVLRTAGVPTRPVPMTFAERILHTITDPNIALLLLTIGTIGIIAELYNPGTWIPGVAGAIALILAFAGLGNLPTNWAGVGLIILAVVLLLAEALTAGLGIFAAASAIAFVLGALFLFRPFGIPAPSAPAVSVNPVLMGALGAGAGAFMLLVLRSLVRTRMAPAAVGPEALVGATGVARARLDPQGVVTVHGEDWTAVAEGGPIDVGRSVRVVQLEGVTLLVQPIDHENDRTP